MVFVQIFLEVVARRCSAKWRSVKFPEFQRKISAMEKPATLPEKYSMAGVFL